MNFTRSKTIWLICVLALAVLSLSPHRHAQSGFALALTPTRVISALASPLRLFDSHSVLAADEEQVAAQRDRCREIRTAFRQKARQFDPSLASGAVVVEAEVLERVKGKHDQVIVRLATPIGIEPGVPAVCGDAYVGRVVAMVPGQPNQASVELVTSSSFRVGAGVSEGNRSSNLIVGGLAPSHALTNGVAHLAAHNPSDRGVRAGIVRVEEPPALALDDEDSRLADGFLLGELREFKYRHKTVTAIRPALDLESGLFHIALLVPVERAAEEIPPLEDLFAPRAWRTGKIQLAGEISAWRAGRKLTLPSHAEVAKGAAVVLGAQLIGRVENIGTTMVDVRLMSDPGTSIPALALLHGEELDDLVVLGTLMSRGLNERGLLVLRWETDRPLLVEAAFGKRTVQASLYTGSGERGVPLGLSLGDCEIPTNAGEHLLEIDFPTVGSGEVEVRLVRDEERSL